MPKEVLAATQTRLTVRCRDSCDVYARENLQRVAVVAVTTVEYHGIAHLFYSRSAH